MKNNEWGAVAYLAASQYGTIPTINSNSSYYTGGSNTVGGYKIVNETVNYPSQSTTGTVNGIYDMNGGASEYVAAANDTKTSNSKIYGFTYYGDDYALIGNSSQIFGRRGGYSLEGTTAGVFSFKSVSNGCDKGTGFRPVLTI